MSPRPRTASRSKGPARPPDVIACRIRERRKLLGLSFGQLAARAGLRSPSYVFHIENGDKFPSERVAARLAEAVGDDVELYRAWARARNRGELSEALAAAALLENRLGASRPGQGATIASAEAAPDPTPVRARAAAIRSDAEADVEPALLLRVPVIADGEDPGDGLVPQTRVLHTLRLEPRLLPPPERIRRPFAFARFDPGDESAAGEPSEYAVVSRDFEALLDPGRTWESAVLGPLFVLRSRSGANRARLHWDGRALHRVDGPGGALGAPDVARLRELVIGTVVLEIRRG